MPLRADDRYLFKTNDLANILPETKCIENKKMLISLGQNMVEKEEQVSNRRYLNLNVRKLYNASLEKHQLHTTSSPVSWHWFDEICKKEFSLTFGAPRVDTCHTCKKYKISIATSEPPVEKNEFQLKRDLRHRKAESAQKMMP